MVNTHTHTHTLSGFDRHLGPGNVLLVPEMTFSRGNNRPTIAVFSPPVWASLRLLNTSASTFRVEFAMLAGAPDRDGVALRAGGYGMQESRWGTERR